MGYNDDFTSGHKGDDFYYDIVYKGSQLADHGEGITATDASNNFASSAPANGSGAPSQFNLEVQQGVASISSGIFEGLVTQNGDAINLGTLTGLRGTANVSGTLNGEEINYALGLNTDSFHPLNILRLNDNHTYTNFIVFGADAERQSNSQESTSGVSSNPVIGLTQNEGIATYNAYFGFPLTKWLAFNSTDSTTYNSVIAIAPDLNTALTKYKSLRDNTDLPSRIVVGIVEQQLAKSTIAGSDSAAWDKEVVAYEGYHNFAVNQYIPLAFEVQSSGWYTLSGDPLGSKAKVMFAADLVHYFPINGQLGSIQVRYENGYTEAAPEVRIDRLFAVMQFSIGS